MVLNLLLNMIKNLPKLLFLGISPENITGHIEKEIQSGYVKKIIIDNNETHLKHTFLPLLKNNCHDINK